MPKLTGSAGAQKWATNSANAAQAYVTGSQNTTKDPTALAAAAAQKWYNNVSAAFQAGTFQSGLARAGKAGWLAGVTGKGAANFTTGVNAALSKATTVFTALYAAEANLQSQIDSMPNITAADAEARMLAWTRGMKALRGQFR
jgi:hypothetical protein